MKKFFIFLDNFDQDYVKGSLENNQQSIDDFVKNLYEMLEEFYRRKDNVFYHSGDIKQFLMFFKSQQIESDLLSSKYLLSLEDNLRELLDDARNWEIEQQSHSDNQYFKWDFCSETVGKINGKVLAEMTERILKEDEDKVFALLLPSLENHPYSCKTYITCFKDKLAEFPQFIKIEFLENKEKIQHWIKNNRTPLVMNKNNKHGENGLGAHSTNKGNKVSKLYCTIEEAQALLDDAIGDKRLSDKLFNYDLTHQKFIVFFYEGDTPQNQYHAFHIDNEEELRKLIPNTIHKELIQKFGIT